MVGLFKDFDILFFERLLNKLKLVGCMKALIPAAGMGERLLPLTKDTNKCVLPIDGKPLLLHIVESLKNCGVDDIFVVTGYKEEKVKEALGDRVKYLHNKDYASTGLLSSVILGKEQLVGSDFLLMTGDSLMHPKIIEDFLKQPGDVLASVELKKCDEEDFKAIIKDGKIVEMSKTMPVDQAAGEFTALVKVSEKVSQAFFKKMEEFIADGSYKKYIADMVVFMQDLGFEVNPVYTNGLPRIEIDFPKDLENAKAKYAEFKNFN